MEYELLVYDKTTILRAYINLSSCSYFNFWLMLQSVLIRYTNEWEFQTKKKMKEKWHKPFRNWRSFLCTYRLVRIWFPQQYERNNDDDEFDVPFNYKKPWKATMQRKFPLTLSKYVSYILTINLLSQWVPALQVNLYWF